jgi:hypothetical protein
MRLSVPPFDDVHVRRALNFVINKRRFLDLCCVASGPAQHVIVNSTLDDLLIDYAPYASPDSAGDVAKARAEMAQSRYDTDHDGRCDAPACRNIRHLDVKGYELPLPELAKIGLHVKYWLVPDDATFAAAIEDNRSTWGLIKISFHKERQSAGDQFEFSFASDNIGGDGLNASLVGASDEQLAAWGSPVRGVPSLDAAIAACKQLVGALQTQCWADATRVLTEDVVPVVPMIAERSARFFSSRIVNPTVGGVYSMPTLDTLALRSDQ